MAGNFLLGRLSDNFFWFARLFGEVHLIIVVHGVVDDEREREDSGQSARGNAKKLFLTCRTCPEEEMPARDFLPSSSSSGKEWKRRKTFLF